MASNYRINQPRVAALYRQQAADRADRAPCPIRTDSMLDRRSDVRAYTHAQATRQDVLKRRRRAERRAKWLVLNAGVYLAQFEDARQVVDAGDLVAFF